MTSVSFSNMTQMMKDQKECYKELKANGANDFQISETDLDVYPGKKVGQMEAF